MDENETLKYWESLAGLDEHEIQKIFRETYAANAADTSGPKEVIDLW